MVFKRIKQVLFLLPVLILFCLTGVNAATVTADTLVLPDNSIIKNDTSAHEEKSSINLISDDFGNRLKSQLNLTDDQTSKVKSIIASYVENYNESTSNSPAGKDIEKLLNDTQQASWRTVQSGFWSDLNKRISETKKK